MSPSFLSFLYLVFFFLLAIDHIAWIPSVLLFSLVFFIAWTTTSPSQIKVTNHHLLEMTEQQIWDDVHLYWSNGTGPETGSNRRFLPSTNEHFSSSGSKCHTGTCTFHKMNIHSTQGSRRQGTLAPSPSSRIQPPQQFLLTILLHPAVNLWSCTATFIHCVSSI